MAHLHYCGQRTKPRAACAACASPDLRLLGIGTQRLERELGERFPEARIARMDRDTTGRRGSHEKILERLAKGEIDILLGTQMIAKGIDFPGVTLVGSCSPTPRSTWRLPRRRADLPAPHAGVGARGRGDAAGRVIVQSFHKDHYADRRRGDARLRGVRPPRAGRNAASSSIRRFPGW